ncbi:hypothetical protein B0H13DRAFT_326081 [Mycena leptocephala]|nr:hypothetical protein B0H13DRAFT_326081 [Mycena leptocephala]
MNHIIYVQRPCLDDKPWARSSFILVCWVLGVTAMRSRDVRYPSWRLLLLRFVGPLVFHHHPRTMPGLFDLSNEIILEIFPHCPLKSIIAATGVCTLWTKLVLLSDIDTTRKALLNLCFSIIESSAFERSRPWLLENLHPFDRQAYIDTLLDQRDYLPDNFRR